jgi:uncharacterized protein YdaU (DUF1376 family)
MKAPAFQFYPADWLSSQRVQMMTLEEEGAYIRLLCYCWNHGSIPADPAQIARLVGKSCSNETATTVQRMFNERSTTVEGSFNDSTTLVHDRLELEKDKQAARRDQASEAGKKSAESRKKPTDVQRESNDRSFFVQRESNPISISSSSPTEEDIILEDDSGFPRDEPKRGRTTKSKPNDMVELIAYSLSEGGNESEAQDFFDKMEAKGWIVGKAKVKDWRAQFRTYHRNGWLNANSSPATRPKSTYVPPRAPEVTWEQHFWDMWDGTKEEGENAVRRRRESFAHFNINIDEH